MANCFKIARDLLEAVAKSVGLSPANLRIKTKASYTGTYEVDIGEVEIEVHCVERDHITFQPTLTIRYNNSPDVQKTKDTIDKTKNELRKAVNKIDVSQEEGLARFGRPMTASEITTEETGLVFTFSVTAEAFPHKEE